MVGANGGDAEEWWESMLRGDLAALDPIPAGTFPGGNPGARLVGKKAQELPVSLRLVLQARYDGTAAAITALASEAGVPRNQIVRWAHQLGIRNQRQPFKGGERELSPTEQAFASLAPDEAADMDTLATVYALTEPTTEERPGEERATMRAVGRAVASREGSKICIRCGEEKPLGAFRPWSANVDGVAAHCRDCGKRASLVRAPAVEPATDAAGSAPGRISAVAESALDVRVAPVATAIYQYPVPGDAPAPEPAPEPEIVPLVPDFRLVTLHALLDALPVARTWTERERERWVGAFLGLLDYTVITTPASVGLANLLRGAAAETGQST